MAMVVLPLVLIPAILVGQVKLIQSQTKRLETQRLTIGVTHLEAAPDLRALLEAQTLTVVSTDGDLAEAVRSGRFDFTLDIPADLSAQLDRGVAVRMGLRFNSTKVASASGVSRVVAAVTAYSQQVMDTRLAEHGVDRALLATANVEPQDIATAQERGGFG